MTANQHEKKAARERAARTGESYSGALHALRAARKDVESALDKHIPRDVPPMPGTIIGVATTDGEPVYWDPVLTSGLEAYRHASRRDEGPEQIADLGGGKAWLSAAESLPFPVEASVTFPVPGDRVEVGTAIYDRDLAQPSLWPTLALGQKVRFDSDRTSMTVRAVSRGGRFVALTRPFNLGRRSKVQYTVIDFALGIRGTATSWGVGFETDEQCAEAMAAFEAGAQMKREPGVLTSEISFRNWCWLRFTDKQVDARTQRLLAALRRTMSEAPYRDYNDHNPRTKAELATLEA